MKMYNKYKSMSGFKLFVAIVLVIGLSILSEYLGTL